jgi:polyphosphate glucokinase
VASDAATGQARPTVLAVDVGGTNVKIRVQDRDEIRKHPSGTELSAAAMVDAVREMAGDWSYEVVSVGFPGPVVGGAPAREPRNLGPGWVGFDFEERFARPVRVINDAAMQALGSYDGGKMLFLGLGTGLGSAVVIAGRVEPMELAHLPYRKGRTYEDYVGRRGMKRLGRKKWERHVHEVVGQLRHALLVDYVVLGGGNAKKLKEVPSGARLGANANAFLGGFRLWDPEHR